MSVIAKFKVDSKTECVGYYNVKLTPVTSGSEENKQFYKWTPSGSLELNTINEDASIQFEVGKEYYLNIVRAE